MSKKQHRINRAIHLHYTTDMTNKEIGEELGVHRKTVSKYLNMDRGKEVQEMLEAEAQHVVQVSLEELKNELRELHGQMERVQVQAEEADTEVKVYRDEDGNIVYEEYEDPDTGVKKMFKVPQRYEVQADDKTRYFRRAEWREIREQIREVLKEMRALTGVDTADKIEIEHSGEVEHSVDDDTMDQVQQLNEQFKQG